jgi:hypothetical protein
MENISRRSLFKGLAAVAAVATTGLGALAAFVRAPMTASVWIKRGSGPWVRHTFTAIAADGGVGIDFGPDGVLLNPGDEMRLAERLSDGSLVPIPVPREPARRLLTTNEQ